MFRNRPTLPDYPEKGPVHETEENGTEERPARTALP